MSSSANDFIAGAAGGMAGLVVGHPFDTTKVQLQTQQGSHHYKGTWDAVKNINKHGWTKGFFRGLGFPLVSYGLVNSVFFGVYGHTIKLLKGADQKRGVTYKEVFCAGCVGGFVQNFVACPVDLVKVVLQSQISNQQSARGVHFKGPTQVIRFLIQKHGLQRMFHGFSSMAVRDVPTFGVYVASYEFLYDQMTAHHVGASGSSLLSGGLAGVLTWTLAIPWDNIKSLIQADPQRKRFTNNWQCIKYIYARNGIQGFFTGLPVCAFRAFPVNAVTFLVYSQSLRFLQSATEMASYT